MLGIGKIIGKFVKNSSQRELGRLNSIVQKINAFTKCLLIFKFQFMFAEVILDDV